MAEHRHIPDERATGQTEGLPHPVVVTVVYAGLAALVLATGLAFGASHQWVVVATISLILAGARHAGRSALELARLRREADDWLSSIRRCSPSSRFAWRAEELTSPRERRLLARSIRRIVAELQSQVAPGAVPMHLSGLRPYTSHLRALSNRLNDFARPVSPAGVVMLNRLLTQPVGPLCERERADELPRAVASILAALEVD
jgi:hypothetical protein